MAKQQRIDPGKITPAAKPVEAFTRPSPDSVAPAAPLRQFGQTKGINIIQRGNVQNVQGYNSFQQLSEAVGKLIPAFDTGMQMYASSEYEKGKNQLQRAVDNIGRESVTKGVEYATINRAVEDQDKIAGIQMDELNYYRRAGVQFQSSVITAQYVKPLFNHAWATMGSKLAGLDHGHPEVLKTKARVTTALMGILNVDENTPGFTTKVVPAINKEFAIFQEKHFQENLKLKKYAKEYQTGYGLEQIMLNNQVGPNYENLSVLKEKVDGFLNQALLEAGLGADGLPMIKKSILSTAKSLHLRSKTDPRAIRALSLLSVMPAAHGLKPVQEGDVLVDDKRYLIGELFGPELEIKVSEVEEAFHKTRTEEQKNGFAIFEENFGNDLWNAIVDGKTEDINKLTDEIYKNDKLAPNFDRSQKANFIKDITESAQNERERVVKLDNDPEWNEWYNKWSLTAGNAWNPEQANKEFKSFYERVPSTKYKLELLKQKTALFKSQIEDKNKAYNNAEMNKIIKSEIKVITERFYPDLMKRILSEGGDQDVLDFMVNNDLSEAEGIRNITTQITSGALNEIDKRLQDIGPGGSIPDQELSKIVREVTDKITGNEQIMKQILPKSFDLKPDPKEQSVIVEGKYGREMSPKDEDLKILETQPIYSIEAIKSIYNRQNDKSGNYNYHFRNTSSRLGISPDQLLLIHLNYYKDNPKVQEWYPDEDELRKLEISGNQAQGMTDGILTAAPGPTALASTSRLIENVLFGV
tara:strand:- start:2089 stop:4347 length:2259 start_codon:yes stop_codon:yes gene_type:complete